MVDLLQPSLAGGEFAPSLQGRVDLARFAVSAKKIRNLTVRPYGGVRNRNGSSLVSWCGGGTSPGVINELYPTRVIPFKFSNDQQYVLELGHNYIKIIYQGGLVTHSGGGVFADYPGSPTRITPGQFVNVPAGDYSGVFMATQEFFSGNVALEIARGWLVPANFATAPYIVGWPDYSAAAVVEVPTDYLGSELFDINFAQLGDVVVLAHPAHPPKMLRRFGHDAWDMIDFDYRNGPWLDMNADITRNLYASGELGEVTVSVSGASRLFESHHIGRLLYMERQDFGDVWEANKSVAEGKEVRSDGRYYRAMNTGTTGTYRPTHEAGAWWDGTTNAVRWLYLHSGFGVLRIKTVASDGLSATATVLSRVPTTPSGVVYTATSTALTSVVKSSTGRLRYVYSGGHGATANGRARVYMAGTFTLPAYPFNDDVVTDYIRIDANTLEFPNLSHDRPYGKDGSTYNVAASFAQFESATGGGTATDKWAFGAWGQRGGTNDPNNLGPGYPSTVAFFKERTWFAGTHAQPQTLWCSRAGDLFDFGEGITVEDDDPITRTISDGEVNRIQHFLVSDKLLLLTTGGVFAAVGGANGVISNATLSFELKSHDPISKLKPVGIANNTVYVQYGLKIISDLGYEVVSDQYTGDEISLTGSHLLEPTTIVDWTYQNAPDRVIWAVLANGTLVGCTYVKRQQISGWHRHDTDGTYESVCCVREGNDDVLYVVVRRDNDGTPTRYVERFYPRKSLAEDAHQLFLDGAVINDKTMLDSTSYNITVAPAGPGAVDVGIVATSGSPFKGVLGKTLWFNVTGYGWKSAVIDSVTDYQHATANSDPGFAGLPDTLTATQAYVDNTNVSMAHLRGKQVYAVVDGVASGPYTVPSTTDGLVTVPAGDHSVLGLKYTQELETLDVNVQGQESTYGRTKNISGVTLLLGETVATVTAGPDATHQDPIIVSYSEGYASGVMDGKVQANIPTTWTRGGRVLFRSTDPFAWSILLISPEVTFG